MFFRTVGARGTGGGQIRPPQILAGVKAKPSLQKTYRIHNIFNYYRSVNFEMSFWCLQFLPKNEQKQVDQRYHSSKVKFVHSFFEKNIATLSDLYPSPTWILRLSYGPVSGLENM